MLSCWWHPPFLPPAFQVCVHYHLFNWVIIVELTITWCHPTAFLISLFFLMCIYSYILREEQLNLFSFVTPFPRIPGSPKSLDMCRARNDPVLSQYWTQAAPRPLRHRSAKKGRWGGSSWTIFNKSSVQPITKTSPGLATAPSSLAVFKGMWWITSPASPREKEKQQDEEALANRLLVPGVNNINRLPAIY